MYNQFVTCICKDCGESFETHTINGKRPKSVCRDCVTKEIEKAHLVKMEKRTEALEKLEALTVNERLKLIEAKLYDQEKN